MSAIKEILVQHHITLMDDLQYKERPIDDRFTAVEISSQEGIRFNLFYYVVDSATKDVFYGTFKYPDGVVIARILNGSEESISGKRLTPEAI